MTNDCRLQFIGSLPLLIRENTGKPNLTLKSSSIDLCSFTYGFTSPTNVKQSNQGVGLNQTRLNEKEGHKLNHNILPQFVAPSLIDAQLKHETTG